jgi:hypothetical protein
MGMRVLNERRDVTHAQLANILMTERPTKKQRSTQEKCLPPAFASPTTRRPRHVSS